MHHDGTQELHPGYLPRGRRGESRDDKFARLPQHPALQLHRPPGAGRSRGQVVSWSASHHADRLRLPAIDRLGQDHRPQFLIEPGPGERKQHVAILTLNQPEKLNAFNRQLTFESTWPWSAAPTMPNGPTRRA